MARLVAVCVTYALKPRNRRNPELSGIDKRPVNGPVRLGALGVSGDRVMETRNHGGRDKAAYAYASEDLAAWAEELGRPLAPGSFGENLSTAGLDVTGAVVGEQWRIGGAGGALVEVCEPRTPCATFQGHLDEARWVRRFFAHGAPGAYLRVLEEGQVRSGDAVEVVLRPAHGVTIGEVFGPRPADPDRLRLLLDTQPDLADALLAEVRRRLRARSA